MRRLILTAMVAGLLAPAGLHAQKVYQDNGKAILDLTVEAGMPASVVTSTSKTDVYDNATPSTSAMITYNDTNGTINATVYRKLEVSLAEGVGDGDGGVGTYKWVEGFNYCKDLDEAGSSDWRLPTQRELQLVYIFKPALEDVIVNDLEGTDFSTSSPTTYWCATEYSDENVWYVNFSSGITTNGPKLNGPKLTTRRVRCVREVVE